MTSSSDSRRRVVFINGAFPPVRGATGELLEELAGWLAAHGWTVEIVTGPGPDAPATTPPGVTVFRSAGATYAGPGRPSIARRAVALAVAMPRLLALARTRARTRPDIVVTMTDPPLGFLAGPRLGRAAGAPVVHWAQDVYPEVAEALGVLRPSLARPLRAVATRALRRHTRIISIGACMTDRLVARGLARDRIVEIPNWSQEGVRPVASEANTIRPTLAPPEAFLVMYSGNMGLAHPFEAMLDAAERVQRAAPDVRFVFVGDGARRPWIEAEAERRRLATVSFAPFQPKERLAESLSAADLHLVSMERELCGLVVPSKVYGVAAAGRPVVFLGPADSEAARFLTAAQAGTILPDASGAELAEAILTWRADADVRAEAGRRAAAAAAAGRQAAFETFDRVLAGLVAPRPGKKKKRRGG